MRRRTPGSTRPPTASRRRGWRKLSPEQVTATELAGEPITAKLTTAPGNGAALGGLKVTTENAWFAARPSGTEDVYKIYAESFKGPEHLARGAGRGPRGGEYSHRVSSDAEGDCPASDRARPESSVAKSGCWSAANVVVALGYGVVAPVLPQYARNFGVSISAATFVITAFALMRLVCAPPAGLLVQRLGERRVYVSGLLIVAVSTGACAFAQTYWQLLLFRSLGGLGSAMFTVSSLGLMIRISPPDARGRVAGLFSSAFLVGSVGGPVLGSLTAGLGLSAPFVIYGVGAAGRRGGGVRQPAAFGAGRARSRAPSHRCRCGRCCATRPTGRRCSSNFATGWSAFGLRIALVPLFVVEVLGRGAGMRGSGAGDVRDRQRLGGDPERLSVRPGRPARCCSSSG